MKRFTIAWHSTNYWFLWLTIVGSLSLSTYACILLVDQSQEMNIVPDIRMLIGYENVSAGTLLMVGLFGLMVGSASFSNYQSNREAMTHEWMIERLQQIVTQALIELLGGTFSSVPRLKRLQAISDWVMEEIPDIKRKYAELAAAIVCYAAEGLDGLNLKRLDELEASITYNTRNAENVKETLAQLRERYTYLVQQVDKLRVLNEDNESGHTQLARDLKEVQQLLFECRPDGGVVRLPTRPAE